MSERKKREAGRQQFQIRLKNGVRHIRAADTEKRGQTFLSAPSDQKIQVLFLMLAAASFAETAAAEEQKDNPQTAAAAKVTFPTAASVAA